MAKSVEERIAGWLKKGFTSKAESLQTHFDELILHVDLEMTPKEMLGLIDTLGKDFVVIGSNFYDLLEFHRSERKDPNAIKIEFGVEEDCPRFSETYKALVDNPKVLGIVTNSIGQSTIRHQKPGFECPEVKSSRIKAPTRFGKTKVIAPFVMEKAR
ncbi:MAG: hypothetical protein AAF244_01520 [Pseudomonadota bacterium]